MIHGELQPVEGCRKVEERHFYFRIQPDFIPARRVEKLLFPLSRREVTGIKKNLFDFGEIEALRINSTYAPLASGLSYNHLFLSVGLVLVEVTAMFIVAQPGLTKACPSIPGWLNSQVLNSCR